MKKSNLGGHEFSKNSGDYDNCIGVGNNAKTDYKKHKFDSR